MWPVIPNHPSPDTSSLISSLKLKSGRMAHPCRVKLNLAEPDMKLKVPQGSFRAYLFDCDGTVVDSMPLHYIAWKKALKEWNCEFDEELFYAWGGMPVAEIISTLNERHGLCMPVEIVARRKESLYFDLLP